MGGKFRRRLPLPFRLPSPSSLSFSFVGIDSHGVCGSDFSIELPSRKVAEEARVEPWEEKKVGDPPRWVDSKCIVNDGTEDDDADALDVLEELEEEDKEDDGKLELVMVLVVVVVRDEEEFPASGKNSEGDAESGSECREESGWAYSAAEVRMVRGLLSNVSTGDTLVSVSPTTAGSPDGDAKGPPRGCEEGSRRGGRRDSVEERVVSFRTRLGCAAGGRNDDGAVVVVVVVVEEEEAEVGRDARCSTESPR